MLHGPTNVKCVAHQQEVVLCI